MRLRRELKGDGSNSTKNVELWGCWYDLRNIHAESLINADVWQEAMDEDFFVSIDRLRSCVSRIHNHILAKLYQEKSPLPHKDNVLILSDLTHGQSLFILKLVFNQIYNIMEAVSTGYVGFADETLNAGYITLLDNLTGILNLKDFEGLKKSLPELPKHLFEDMDDLDTYWEDGGRRRDMMSFVGDIEAAWIRAGMPVYELPKWLEGYFTEINNTATKHRKEKAAKWDAVSKRLEGMHDKGDFFGTPTPAPNTPPKSDDSKKIITALDGAITRGFDSMFPTPITGPTRAVVALVEPEKPSHVPNIKIEGDSMVFGINKIPVERGQKSMAELFLKNAKIYRGSSVAQNGTPIDLNAYKNAGGYGSEYAFRNGLNKLRSKIKKAGFPVCIENPQTRIYQMVIRYTKKQK